MSQITASAKKSILAFRVAPDVKELVTQLALSEGLAPSEWLRKLVLSEFKRRNLTSRRASRFETIKTSEKSVKHSRVNVARRRDKFEIFADILRAALDGAKTTEIIYRVNLNSKRFKAYSEYLIEAGFLEVLTKPGRLKIYRTTDRGRSLLRFLSGR